MGKHSAEVRRYLREVRSCLPCGWKEKRKILGTIHGMIDGYLSENPDGDYARITARFGTPKQIAATYVEEKETGELLQDLRVKRKIIGVVVATAAMLIFLWAGVVVAAYVGHAKDADGYAVVEVIEIERTVNDEGGE